MIGPRIRQRREDKGISMRELARRVEMTASYISQLERDLADPSIKTLRKIADALDVSLMHFLSEEEPQRTDPVVRKDKRKILSLPTSKLEYELLTPDLARKMEVFIGRLDPTQKNVAFSLRHPTEECLLVLEGRICVELEDGRYELNEGDSIYFEGRKFVNLYAIGEKPAKFISAITPAVF